MTANIVTLKSIRDLPRGAMIMTSTEADAIRRAQFHGALVVYFVETNGLYYVPTVQL